MRVFRVQVNESEGKHNRASIHLRSINMWFIEISDLTCVPSRIKMSVCGGQSQSQVHFKSTRLAVIFRAESRQRCHVGEDRSGSGNDKSTYESKTGRRRQAFCVFFADTSPPAVVSKKSYRNQREAGKCEGGPQVKGQTMPHLFWLFGVSLFCHLAQKKSTFLSLSSGSCLCSFGAHCCRCLFVVKLSIIY